MSLARSRAGIGFRSQRTLKYEMRLLSPRDAGGPRVVAQTLKKADRTGLFAQAWGKHVARCSENEGRTAHCALFVR